jgi:hypothetical protein
MVPDMSTGETQMQTIETTKGSRKVISTSNGEGYDWSSRLYVNGGETATLICAKHKSEAGVRKWAAKVLAG